MEAAATARVALSGQSAKRGTCSERLAFEKVVIKIRWIAILHVKAVRANEHEPEVVAAGAMDAFSIRKHMKTFAILTIAIGLLASATAVHARGGRGLSGSGLSGSSHGSYGTIHSSGYVYRNPYAAYPSVGVRGYTNFDGTYVVPHYRTPANHTVTDNLSYRGYGTVRVPR